MSGNDLEPPEINEYGRNAREKDCGECIDKKFRAQKSTSNIFKLATQKPEIRNQGGQSQIHNNKKRKTIKWYI